MSNKFNLQYFNKTTTKGKDKLFPYIKFFEEILKAKLTNKKVLDIGCATGNLSELLDESNYYTGIDISADAVNIAKETHPKKEFFLLDINERELEQFSDFNVIFLLDVIEHLENLTNLKRFLQRLKPNSILIVTTPNANSLDRFLFNKNSSVEHDPTHLIVFTIYTLNFFLLRTGLKKIYLGTPYSFYFKANYLTSLLPFGGQIFGIYEKK